MAKNLCNLTLLVLIIIALIVLGMFLRQNKSTWALIKTPLLNSYKKFHQTIEVDRHQDFELVKIKSSTDNEIQKCYFYQTKSKIPKALIVSLHTWSGDFSEYDKLAELSRLKDLNYIHPDFRGPNKSISSCSSELTLSDIDDAITFAIENSNVDTSKIYVIGASGGGYATLNTFMKSKHKIKKFSAWASITDLSTWYRESKIRNNTYAENILSCTGSGYELNVENAKLRSPIYQNTPTQKLIDSKLLIYAGIYDGIQGSVPITHSINFYNKILVDLTASDSSKYVSAEEKLRLLEFRKPIGEYGQIQNRKISLKKEYKNVRLTLFEGHHEMLAEFALDELLEE